MGCMPSMFKSEHALQAWSLTCIAGMVAVADFFADAPPSVEAPEDAGLANRVQKFAEYASRSGPSFVQLMRQKQQDNPEFSFLEEGEGSAFYRWTLYSKLAAQPGGPPPITRRSLLGWALQLLNAQRC